MNQQKPNYQQLTQEPRYQISALREIGMSLRAIAEKVGMHYSSVSRELKRNSTADGYDPAVAQLLSSNRKKESDKASRQKVFHGIHKAKSGFKMVSGYLLASRTSQFRMISHEGICVRIFIQMGNGR